MVVCDHKICMGVTRGFTDMPLPENELLSVISSFCFVLILGLLQRLMGLPGSVLSVARVKRGMPR